MMGPQWVDMGLGLGEPWTVQMEVKSPGASTPLQACIGVADPWLLLPHDSCANIINFSSALHINELGQGAKCQWQSVLQARALRGMPSRLSGANRDKNTRSRPKIDRDSRVPREWEKPEEMGSMERMLSIRFRSGKECSCVASSARVGLV